MAKKVKQKKCAYSECGKMFTPMFSTTQRVCSPKCSIQFNSEKEIKKRYEEAKIEVEGTNLLEQAARKIFQKWIRERDKNEGCISCGKTEIELGKNMYDAGHFYSAERFSGLIFHEMNVHKQCKQCNGTNMHGNLAEYRKGLVAKFGDAYVNHLDEISNPNREYKYQRSQLIDIANKYKTKLKNEDFTSDKPNNI